MIRRTWNGKLAKHSTVAQSKPSQKQLQILEILKAENRPMTVKELKAITGGGPGSVRARLQDLESMNMVESYPSTGKTKTMHLWQLPTTLASG